MSGCRKVLFVRTPANREIMRNRMRWPLNNCSKGVLVGANLRSASKNFRKVFASNVAQMKLPGLGHAVGFVDEFRFGDGDEFVEHAVYASIARSRLVD